MNPLSKLTSVCLLALFAGTAALADTEIRITHPMSAGANKEAFDKIVAAFEAANPGITIKQIVFDDDIYSDTGLITQLQGNEVPDIYFQWAGFPVQRDTEAGYAGDLTGAMADGWKDSFIDSAFADGSGTVVDGNIRLVPISLDVTNTIWYNKTIFAENNLTPPETWDEFLTVVKSLAAAGETPIITGNNELWPLGNWASHVAARSVPPADYDAAFRQQKTFAEAGFLKPLQLMQGLAEAGAFNKDMQGLGADPAMAGFFQEAAAMHPIGSWLVGSEGDLAAEGFQYGEFNTPIIDPAMPGAKSVIGTMTGFVLGAKAEHPAEATAFLKFLTSQDSAVIWAESGSISPVKGVSDKAQMSEQMKGLSDMLAAADAMASPPDTTYPVPVAEAYYQAAAYAASGEKTADEALAWLDETVGAMPKP